MMRNVLRGRKSQKYRAFLFSLSITTSFVLIINYSACFNFQSTSGNEIHQNVQMGPKSTDTLSLLQTPDSGYLIAGSSHIFGLEHQGAIILKLDKQGIIQWYKTYPEAGIDEIQTITYALDSGYLLAGSSYTNLSNKYDMCFFEIDQDGNLQWNNTVGGSKNDYGHVILPTDDGSYLVAGDSQSFTVNESDIDMWVIKTTKDGVIKWNQTYGNTLDQDFLYSIIRTSDNEYVLVGFSSWNDLDGFGINNVLIKISNSGELIWKQSYGDSGSLDSAYSALSATDGYIVVAGTAGRQGELSKMSLWKVNTSKGNLLWQKTYPSVFEDSAYCVVETIDQGFLLIGYSSSVNYGNTDIKIIKTDGDGNSQWITTYNKTWNDGAYACVPTVDGGYAVVGYITINEYNDPRPWFIKLNDAGEIQWDSHLNISSSNYSTDPFKEVISPLASFWLFYGLFILSKLKRKRSIK